MNPDTSTELTELRAQLALLRAENAVLRAQNESLVPVIPRLLQSQTMGVFVGNLNGEVLAMNAEFERMIGQARAQIGHFDWRERVPPEEVGRHEIKAREVWECGWCAPWETAFSRADGTRVPVLTGATLIGGADALESALEDRSSVLIWAVDISQRVRAENELRASESQMRAIVENLHDGLLITDLDDAILYANGRMSELTGYSNAELVGQIAYRLLSAPDIWEECQARNAQRAQGQSGTYEIPLRHRDGSTRWMLINGSPLRDNSGAIVGTIGAHFDYDERKAAEAERAHFAARLQQSNRELETYAFAVSHDLKQPLRKIEVFSSRLQSEEAANLSEQGQFYLDRIGLCTRRMTALINGLLAYSRATTSHVLRSEIDLNDVAREVMLDLELAVERARAQVILGDLPRVAASATQMRQLLQNLIGNALEYRRPDVPLVVRVSARIEEGFCHLEVADNGRGFDQQHASQIFEMFSRLKENAPAQTQAAQTQAAQTQAAQTQAAQTQAAQTQAAQTHGTGVGLAICRAIVQRHGGTLTARSAPGEGATFCARFPLALPHEFQGEAALDS